MTNQRSEKIRYDAKVWFLAIVIISSLGLITFYLKQNFFPKYLTFFTENEKVFYLYEPPYLEKTFHTTGANFQTYQEMLEKFTYMNRDLNYKMMRVGSLENLNDAAMVILLDNVALSKEDQKLISTYVDTGGAILFNSYTAFRDKHSKFQGDTFIRKITGLKLSQEHGEVRFNKGLFASAKLLSPLTSYLVDDGKLMSMASYDTLPIFQMKKNSSADVYMTNWDQVSYPKIAGKTMNKRSSGLVWSGTYGKGKWVYFSFPLYTFFESLESVSSLKNLYKGMVSYLNESVILRAYPYIDAKSVSFVSEDTEYRYESLRQFSDLSLKYKIPVSAFCVAKLAEENRQLMHYVQQNPYLSFGSHSYTHQNIVGSSDDIYRREIVESKKLMESITQCKVTGFRPPREEIDAKMFTFLKEAKYTYVLNKSDEHFYPHFKDDIVIIPRRGTDDYSYFVTLDWSAEQIKKNMIKESQVSQELNGIYSMSTHSHLMSYSTNIAILEGYFQYLKTASGMTSLSGEMIQERVEALKNISIVSTLSDINILITIANANKKVIKDFTFRLYAPHKTITSVTSEHVGKDIKLKLIRKGVYDITISTLKADRKLVLFAKYSQ